MFNINFNGRLPPLLSFGVLREVNNSWYVKQNLASVVNEYENLDMIGNARVDSVMYDLPPAPKSWLK